MNGIFYNGKIEDNYINLILLEVYGKTPQEKGIYDQFLSGKKDLTILDIGGNLGLTANYFSQFGKVFVLEPSKEHFECMSKLIEQNKLNNVTAINKALYIKDGTLPFFHNRNKTMFSLHQSVNDNSSPPEEVECIAIDTLLNEYKIEHVDFMKLDIEGSEVEVISSKGFKDVASKIDMMVIEVHAWNGRNPNQLVDTLKMRGFYVETLPADANIIVARK